MLVFGTNETTVVPAGMTPALPIAADAKECQLMFAMFIPTAKKAVLAVVRVVVPFAVAVI
jgi:hypothetical protein